MKVTFTSVVWQEVYDKITELNEMFSEVIAPKFRDRSFGEVDENFKKDRHKFLIDC